jgi:hypothetical protein
LLLLPLLPLPLPLPPPPPPHATRWPRPECDISILLPLLATQ